MTLETPVLIVGGGPVGLALALELGWRGVPCILVEQTDGVIALPKMNVVNIRTMEFCRRWGMDAAVRNCPFPEDFPMDVAFVTRLGGYELGRVERPARRQQRPGPASPMNMQVCSQVWFDPMLRERAQSFAGVRLLHRHRMESFRDDGKGVSCEIVSVDGGERIAVRASHLAACDGAASGIREHLGIGVSGSGFLSRSLHVFFRAPNLLERLEVRPTNFFLLIDRDGLWGSLRAIDPSSGLWRLMLDKVEDGEAPADFDALLARAVSKRVPVEWLDASLWTRRGVVAERYTQGRVHLVGDAAHQVSPTGGLGMNTGIADAVDLAWKIAAVGEGWGGEHLLASYDAERRRAGEWTMRLTTEFYEGATQVRGGLDSIEEATREGEATRERVGRHLAEVTSREFRTLGLQLGFRYDGSPIVVDDGSAAPPDDPAQYTPTSRPGARAPHVPLGEGRSTLDLFGRGFVLLRLGADAPEATVLLHAAALRRVPIEAVTLEAPEVLRVYERRLVLVRPDGHVAWRGDALPADPHAIIDRVRGA